MNFRNWTSWFLSLLVLTTFLVGCGRGPENKILGEWRSSGNGMVPDLVDPLEFYEDGTVQGTVKGIPITGTYSFVNDHEVRLDIPFYDMVVEVYFPEENEMRIIFQDFALKYHRTD